MHRTASVVPVARVERSVALHVRIPQQLRRRDVEALVAADLIEAADEILGADVAAVGAGVVGVHAALVHHHDAVAEGGGLLHGVRHHQRGQLVLGDDLLGGRTIWSALFGSRRRCARRAGGDRAAARWP